MVSIYGTYLGGLGSNILPERGAGIGVDSEGNAYVSGTTQCIGFPKTNTISGALNGSPTALMLGAISGTTSHWSPTTLAGTFDQVDALAFDSSGNLYAGTSAVNAAGGGVYKLAIGSSTWEPAGNGITTTTITRSPWIRTRQRPFMLPGTATCIRPQMAPGVGPN